MNADVNLKDCRGLTPLDVAGFKAGGYYNFIDHDQNASGSLADQNAVFQEMYPSLVVNQFGSQKFTSGANSAVSSRRQSFSENPDFRIPNLYPSISMTEKTEEEDDDEFNEAEFHSTQESTTTTYNVVKMLIEFGAKVKDENSKNDKDSIDCRKNPTTTLHTAVLNNDLKLIDWLLQECQCDHMLITVNDDGDTPLHVAVKRRYFGALRNMISWLDLDTLNMTDKQGMTALYLAVDLDWLKGVSILLEAGADIKIKTDQNETVINLAVRKNNPKLLDELLSAEEEPELVCTIIS